jgi:hypothetical protein
MVFRASRSGEVAQGAPLGLAHGEFAQSLVLAGGRLTGRPTDLAGDGPASSKLRAGRALESRGAPVIDIGATAVAFSVQLSAFSFQCRTRFAILHFAKSD